MNCSRISPVKVGDLVKDVRNGRIGLPDLQRPFVWKDNKEFYRVSSRKIQTDTPTAKLSIDNTNRILCSKRIQSLTNNLIIYLF